MFEFWVDVSLSNYNTYLFAERGLPGENLPVSEQPPHSRCG